MTRRCRSMYLRRGFPPHLFFPFFLCSSVGLQPTHTRSTDCPLGWKCDRCDSFEGLEVCLFGGMSEMAWVSGGYYDGEMGMGSSQRSMQQWTNPMPLNDSGYLCCLSTFLSSNIFPTIYFSCATQYKQILPSNLVCLSWISWNLCQGCHSWYFKGLRCHLHSVDMI